MLKVCDIHYAYGKKQVLGGAAFEAAMGECIGIAGMNGSGKSTLLSIIAGARRTDSGQCLFEDQDALQNPRLFARYVGYVPQDNPLIEELTVKDNLLLWYGGKKQLDRELAQGFLTVLEIEDLLKTPVGRLSGGQKKRVSIGCAMASHPKVLIMDEPGAALDLICKAQIQRYLQTFLALKGTIVLSTHEEAELDLCRRLYVLKQGKLCEVAPELRGGELMKAMILDTRKKEA